MEVLVNKPFDHAILVDGDNAYIVVVCGTSALFDVWIKKSQSEVRDLMNSQEALKSLIEATRFDPEA